MGQCQGVNRLGKLCGASPIRGTDFCLRHTIGADAFREQARLGGKNRQQQRKLERVHGEIEDAAFRARLLRGLARLLDSDDLRAAESGVLATVLAFGLGADREEMIETLAKIRPHRTLTPYELASDHLEAARERLRDLHRAGRISADELPVGIIEPA